MVEVGAKKEYARVCAVIRGKEYWDIRRSEVADAADAVIAGLESENELLRGHKDVLIERYQRAEYERDIARTFRNSAQEQLAEVWSRPVFGRLKFAKQECDNWKEDAEKNRKRMLHAEADLAALKALLQEVSAGWRAQTGNSGFGRFAADDIDELLAEKG